MALALVFSLISAAGLLASLLVVVLLRRQLRRMLVDLCQGEHRAEFWVAASGVWIVLTGLLAGTATLGYWNSDGSVDLFGGATSQVRLLLFGLLGAVLAVAAVLLIAINRRSAPAAPAWGPPPGPASSASPVNPAR